MFDEITGEKKVCLKRQIHNHIFSVLTFENKITLLSRGLMFEIFRESEVLKNAFATQNVQRRLS